MRLLTVIMIFIAAGALAMINTLSLDELAAKSDEIVAAKVKTVVVVDELPHGIKVVSNLLQVEQSYKGALSAGDKIRVRTYAQISGAVELEENADYLFFLHKVEGEREIFNALQGCWAINEDGSFSGMGRDYSLEDVKDALNPTTQNHSVPRTPNPLF